jgi:hypothetical protein
MSPRFRTSYHEPLAPLATGIPWLDNWLGGGLERGSITEVAGYGVIASRAVATIMATQAASRVLVVNLLPNQALAIPHPRNGSILRHDDLVEAMKGGTALGNVFDLVIFVAGPILRMENLPVARWVSDSGFEAQWKSAVRLAAAVVLSDYPALDNFDTSINFLPTGVPGTNQVKISVKATKQYGTEFYVNEPVV